MNKRRAVITGMGVVAPNGTGISEFTQNLIKAKSGIVKINELEELKFNCQIGGICKFDDKIIKTKFSQLNIPIISRSSLILATACYEALQESKLLSTYDFESENDYDIIIGSTIGPADIWGDKIIDFVNKGKHLRLGSFAFEQIINSSPAATLSGILGTTGRVISNSLACASSTEAIIEAANRIINSNRDLIFAGGVEPYSKYYWASMDAMRITNSNFNNNPEAGSRPMSKSAKGFIPAEGGAIIIIEEYEHAKKRNAPILAEIVGSHINCGGQRKGGSMTGTNKEKLNECISKAIKSANINGSQIDLISGHLTGTKSDPIEIEAWLNASNCNKENFPYINSTKSLIGHSIGACGAIETVASIIQMKNNFIHASINCEDLNPEISKLIPKEKIIQKTKNNIKINYIAKANFGFGDVNSCLILKSTNE